MDEARLNELNNVRQAMLGGATPYEAYTMNCSSGVDVPKTVGFIGDVGRQAEEWQTAKSVYNGLVVQTGRGLLGTGKMLNELWAKKATENGYAANSDELMLGWNNLINSSSMQRYNVDDTFSNHLAEGAGQLMSQVALALVTKGVGNTAIMGTQIAGNQYIDLRDQGVDVNRAATAGLVNAAIQAPLERIGLGKILKGSPAASAIQKKALAVLEGAATEFATETVQEFPEQFTNLWAKNPQLDAQGVAREWDKNAVQNIKDALYSGVIGGILGGAGSGIRVAQMTFDEKVQEHIHKDKLETTAQNIQEVIKRKINPEYAAAIINNKLNGGESVAIDAQALQTYMQQVNPEQVAESLGVTVEDINTAAENGQDIDVSYGDFVGAAVKQGEGFFSNLQEHIAFMDNEETSINAARLKRALRQDYELSQRQTEEMNTELDKIIDSATKAGVSMDQGNGLRELLISRAMIANPDNPAQFFRDNPLEFNNAGKKNNGSGFYFQAAYHGSPYRFDAFNLQAIGTGEGAQAHGWGLYFALDREVAQEYKERLSQENRNPIKFNIGGSDVELKEGATSITINGKTINDPDIISALNDLSGVLYKKKTTSASVNIEEALAEAEKIGKHWQEQADKSNFRGSRRYAESYQRIIAGYKQLLQHGNSITVEQKALEPTLYKVDVPELDTMLDEDMYLEEQPDVVQNAVLELLGEEASDLTGKQIYRQLAKKYGSPMQASIELKKRGVQGISYDGRKDGDCVVVFDDQAVNILNTYQQQYNDSTKGAIQWEEDGKAIINLFKGADASTVIHETGHYFVEAFMKQSALETADPRLKKDRAALLEYVGMTEEQWNTADFEGKRAAHEKLAEGFETYIMEGKAPNRELRSVFRKFANWLKKVYESISRNPNAAELTPEVREVFDRWLATDEEIKTIEKVDGYFASLPKIMTDNLNQKYQDKLKDYIADAHDKAVEILLKESMKGFNAEHKKKVQAFKDSIRPEVEQQVADRPVYQAINAIKEAAEALILGTKKQSAKTIARKYLNPAGKEYASWKEETDAVNAAIDGYLQQHIDVLESGVGEIEKYYTNRETGEEADVSDLKGKQELDEETGSFELNYDYGESAPWFTNWWKEHKRKITKADIRQLAYDLATGKDEYHVYGSDYWDMGLEGEKEFREAKADLDHLLNRQQQLKDLAAGKRADYQGNAIAAYKDAVMLQKHKVAPAKIESLTGWKFKEGKWSYSLLGEMSVDNTKIADLGKTVTLGKILDAKTLFQKFPFLKDVKVMSTVQAIADGNSNEGHFGYIPGSKIIQVQGGVKTLKAKDNAKVINGLPAELAPIIQQILKANGVEVNEKAPMLSLGDIKIANINPKAESWTPKLSNEDRVTFELIAESFGFTSGDHLAYNIINNPNYEQAVQRQLQVRADEQFPDVMAERKQAEDVAREALYNDQTGKVIALEQQLIYDQLVKKENQSLSEDAKIALEKQLREAAKLAARDLIRKMPMAKARAVKRFINAERRAAAKAQECLANGDFENARLYKEQQALNHALAMESKAIRETIAKGKKLVRRMRKAKKETWGQQYHFEQAAMLLARMGVGRKDFDVADRKATLQQYIAEQQALGADVDIAEWLTNETIDIRNPNELTLGQYEDILDALNNIKAIAKAENEQFKLEKENTFALFKDKMLKELGKLETKYVPKPGESDKASAKDRFLASMRNTDNLFELMDGWTYGYFSKTFGSELKACADREATMYMDMQERMEKAYKEWLPDEEARKAAAESKYYQELGTSCDKFTLIQMLCNLGTESGSRVLCGTAPIGFKNSPLWVFEGGDIDAETAYQQTKANLIAFLGENLTAADVRYAQKKIDNANVHWEALEQVNLNTKGFAPKKENAAGFVMQLADGQTVYMKGGYFPLVRDSRMGSRPASSEALYGADTEQSRNTAALHTYTGSSKARVTTTYEIDLSNGAEMRSIQDTMHDICYREVMADFRKILKDKEIYGELKTKLGIANWQQFKEMLEKTANPYNNAGMANAERDFAAASSWLRRKTVNAAIMMNLKTSMQNLGNIFLYGRVVDGFGYNDVKAAMGRWGLQGLSVKGNNELNAICSKSVFMRERVLFPDISVREIVGDGDMNAIEKKTMKWGAQMLAYTDNITAKPMWAQAYSKKIKEGATEQEAIDFADLIVRRTLGSSRTQDVSSMMRGGPIFKLFTTFQGFFNTQFNQWEREANIDWKLIKDGNKREAAERITAFVASKYLFNCMAALVFALENPFEDDGEDKGLLSYNISKEIMHYPLSMCGPIGQAGNMMLNYMFGIRSYGYRMAAIQSSIDRVFKLGRAVSQATSGDIDMMGLVEAGASVAGPAVGVPDQVNKAFFNAFDILFNDMDPELHDVVARRPKSKR